MKEGRETGQCSLKPAGGDIEVVVSVRDGCVCVGGAVVRGQVLTIVSGEIVQICDAQHTSLYSFARGNFSVPCVV